jgi:hypothetical protein
MGRNEQAWPSCRFDQMRDLRGQGLDLFQLFVVGERPVVVMQQVEMMALCQH